MACCRGWDGAAVSVRVKKPDNEGALGLLQAAAEVPGDQAFRPLKDGGCPLVK
jgi:branched-chain amino acid transport system substrate-binding protein